MNKYVVQVIDLRTNCLAQESDPHTWVECEEIYQAYKEDYDNCNVVISKYST